MLEIAPYVWCVYSLSSVRSSLISLASSSIGSSKGDSMAVEELENCKHDTPVMTPDKTSAITRKSVCRIFIQANIGCEWTCHKWTLESPHFHPYSNDSVLKIRHRNLHGQSDNMLYCSPLNNLYFYFQVTHIWLDMIKQIKIIECPRDAMQGMEEFIPTATKVEYINQLLKVGFDTIDFGSFVSPKAIPQMRDTKEVLDQLDLSSTKSKLLAIVANVRGGEEACRYPDVDFIGFPLSISETFQKRNTNQSIAEALNTLNDLNNVADKSGKALVAYISMGFGNPYQDPYDPETVLKFSGILKAIGVNIISLADTIGVAEPKQIQTLFTSLTDEFKEIEFGVHLHSTPTRAKEKIVAAVAAGCKRFDGALLGFGGCPMADDELVGNIDTTVILSTLSESGNNGLVNDGELKKSLTLAHQVFQKQSLED
jgi:hydroxymethylglutaryl-CoA lyase